MNEDTLTTLTVTVRERRKLASILVLVSVLADENPAETMALWERVSEGLPEVSS